MKLKFDINISFTLLFLLCFVYACANRGSGPSGGPKDETPPSVIKSIPTKGAVNFKKKEIIVEFDENVSLEKLSENVVISPPQRKNPAIIARGKRVLVKFEDELMDSTTYTINFGNAIVDLNEKNPLENYRFDFSTGNEIDTLGISGYLLNSEDLNPLAGITVGIYSESDDSVFTQKPFLRIAKTNTDGFFYIDNVKTGKYKIFALEDNNRDYYFQLGEGLAMYDSIVSPSTELIQKIDTIWSKKDSTKIDTILSHIKTRFLPDSVILRFFKENKKHQRLIKSTRLSNEIFTLYFNTTLSEMPTIETLNFEWEEKHIVQKNNTLDTINYWLTDSILWQMDTLKIAVNYFKTDSVFQPVATTDTINLAMRKTRVNTKNKKQKEVPKIEPLVLKTNIKNNFDVYRNILLSTNEPLKTHDFSKVVLSQKKDTILLPLDYSWELYDSTRTNFLIKHEWEPTASYELKVDSASFVSVYNKTNNELKTPFTIRSLEEYSKIKVVLTQNEPRAVIELLDSKDAVIQSKPAEQEGVIFNYLEPTDYYLRLFIDSNENGKWDTGNFQKKEQPEEVFYFPKKLTLKANFEFTENWDHTDTHLLKQKPQALKKKEKKEK